MIDISQPVTFRYKKYWVGGIAFFLGGIGFATIGVCMILQGAWGGWFVTGFFGLIFCVFLLQLLPNYAYLRVSRDGLEFRESFHSVLIAWKDIESFEVVNYSPNNDFVEVVLSQSAMDPGDRFPIHSVYGALPLTLANVLTDWLMAVRRASEIGIIAPPISRSQPSQPSE